MRDIEIIEHIRRRDREKALRYLYKELPKVKANIIASGGDKATAEEIFHDALLLLVEKVTDPGFELTSKLSTYLYGIARFLWMNELRKQNKSIALEWSDTLIVSSEDLNYDEGREARFDALDKILMSLTVRCQEVFDRFYFKKESMKTIATALGFSNVNSVKTQKYKCMEQAIKLSTQL